MHPTQKPESHFTSARWSQMKAALRRGPRATLIVVGVLLLAAAWYGGTRAISIARMSKSLEFIRWCGGTFGLKSEDRKWSVQDGYVQFEFAAGVPPKGVDWHWASLFFGGHSPQDVTGIEIPVELAEVAGPAMVHHALETACTFPGLETLILECASVSAEDKPLLAGLKNLKLLVVSSASDRAALQTLLAGNPNCEIYLTDPETQELTRLR